MPHANPEDEKRYRRERYRLHASVRRQKHQNYMKSREKRIASARARKLRAVFGLTPQALDALYQAQHYRCAICGKTEDEALVICNKKLFVDHDHGTGRIRGLLCMKCNGGLGMFSDSIEMLERALEYLRR